jgi:phospholipase C
MKDAPIQHVVLLVRENKTYDAELGDLSGADGDANLALFPEKNTPNLHALARQFTNLDNFYSNSEASIQGHAWTTGSTANDFIEKAWFTEQGYRASLRSQADLERAIARPKYGSIFEVLDTAGIDFVVYGEIFAFRTALGAHFDGYYPGGPFFNLDVADTDKAAYVAGRIQNDGFLPRFTYLLLPRNHTYGTTPGKPTPQAMVADNDVASGQVIDALSHSKVWSSTVVFLIEDDPQDGGDHVEAHRSPCLVIGPWARHAAAVNTHYDVSSLYRTIELLLGIGPMNRGDANAAAMVDAFADHADPSTYSALPAQVPLDTLNPADAPGAAASAKMDFSGPDRAAGLGAVLWRAIKGTEPPFTPPPDDD